MRCGAGDATGRVRGGSAALGSPRRRSARIFHGRPLDPPESSHSRSRRLDATRDGTATLSAHKSSLALDISNAIVTLHRL